MTGTENSDTSLNSAAESDFENEKSPLTLENAPLSQTVFWGPHGLRAGWSALLFASIFLGILFGLTAGVGLTLKHLHHHMGTVGAAEMSPTTGYISESILLASALLATLVMSLMEGKSILSYGLGGTSRARHFITGLLTGFGFMSLLIGILIATHHVQLAAPAFHAAALWKYAALWAGVFLLVGLAEECLLRGYLLFAIARGLRFRTAALLLAVLFAALHKSNPGESPFGLAAAAAAALVFSLSLWRIGSLWWAIGFHAAWDWAQSFFYGTRDSGILSQGHMMTAHPLGSVWLSGGATGPEGSVWCALVLALAAGWVMLTQKKVSTTNDAS